MKILYFAVHEQNAPWGAECFVNKALQTLGHETFCIDYRKYKDSLIELYDKVPEHDILLVQRGDGFPLEILKKETCPKIFWSSELFSRCKDQYRLLKDCLFDHVFMRTDYCRNSAFKIFEVPLEKSSILLSGFDGNFYKPDTECEKKYDVFFFGTLTDRRKRFLSELEKYIDFVYSDSAYGEELVKLIQESRILLNIHSDSVTDTETRVYEVLGTGSLLISETLSKESPFIDRKHLVECKNFYEMVAQSYFYLRNPTELQTIALSGCHEAHENHTYLERAKQIINIAETLL
jgi:hypothetical protein